MSTKPKTKTTKPTKESDSSTFIVVLRYCLLIIILPIVTFFSSKTFLFDGLFNMSQVASNIYSAVSAIIALHVALGLYIYRAYFDTKPTTAGEYKED